MLELVVISDGLVLSLLLLVLDVGETCVVVKSRGTDVAKYISVDVEDSLDVLESVSDSEFRDMSSVECVTSVDGVIGLVGTTM